MLNASGLLAGIAERKDFQLDDAEAKALADATRGVARHYSWLSGVSERGQDWFNLFMITGVIVGARWNNPNAPKTQSGTVVQFPVPARSMQSAPPGATTTVSAAPIQTVTSAAMPDPSPINAVNLTLSDLYSVEVPGHDGPVQ